MIGLIGSAGGIAMLAMCSAAFKYFSVSTGDSERTSPMLSKP
jgi:hypothetical protein